MSRKNIEELRSHFADSDRDFLLLLVDEYGNILQTMHKALKLTTLTPEIRSFLEANDPMALRQIEYALHISEATVNL